jgi:hypothetical protein
MQRAVAVVQHAKTCAIVSRGCHGLGKTSRTAPHTAKQVEALVTDVDVDALHHEQVLDLVRSAAVRGQLEADAGKHDEFGVYKQLREDAGREALESTKDDGPDVCGLLDEARDLGRVE